jgi:hypothetical protein
VFDKKGNSFTVLPFPNRHDPCSKKDDIPRYESATKQLSVPRQTRRTACCNVIKGYLGPEKKGRHEYRFVVDAIWHDDAGSVEGWTNEFGSINCVIWV